MTRICTLLAAALATAITCSAKIERTVDRSIPVTPGVRLEVLTSGGTIRLEPSSDPVIHVIATERIHASSEAEADRLLAGLDLVIERQGDKVIAKAAYHGSLADRLSHMSWPPVEVDFTVSAPAGTFSDLKTSGGDVTVGDMNGEIHAKTSGGDISLGRIHADVDAATSGGNIKVLEAHGTTRLVTSGGEIVAELLRGTSLLETSGGDIKIGSADGPLAAHTSGGDVKARFNGPLQGDCSLTTSGGEVKISVAAGSGFKLDAETSGGEVNVSDLSLSGGRISQERVSGRVNGGGPLLKLRSSGGDIVVAQG